jgi:cellobiose-specific phosphotransferase system component IIB
MATVVLVCAAGVSGTFLARRIAPSLPGVEFVVTTEHALDEVLSRADAVLIAAQLASAEASIRLRAAPRPVAVLPAQAMTPAGSILAVDAVDALVQSLSIDPLAEPPLQRSTDNA